MEFDEQDILGFPTAMKTPGLSDRIEMGVDSALASSMEPRMGLRIHAPGLDRATGDSVIMIFGSHCAQTLDLGSAAPLRSSHTRH